VNIESIETLLNKIMNQYNQQPVGWNVLLDFKGNSIVLGPKEGYMLKTVFINPKERLGVGMKIEDTNEIQSLVKGAPSYGYRPLSRPQAKSLLDSIQVAEEQNRLISEILMNKPVSTSELRKKRPNVVLSGPVIAHPDLGSISGSQSELELKLKIEAEKLFRKEYPNRAAIYS
jgi:hypothetical protein